MRIGPGLVLFQGGSNPLKAGIEGAVLSELIEVLTHAPYSHSALLLPDGQTIVQSTIWNDISGPQESNLDAFLTDVYAKKGGHAWYRPFMPQFMPDWTGVQTSANRMIELVAEGKLHYSVKRLFADATQRNFGFAALPVAGILDWIAEHDKGIVCSECVGLLLQAGGVRDKVQDTGFSWFPKVNPPGQPIGCSPGDVNALPIWEAMVEIL
jgi:hypothetical protein